MKYFAIVALLGMCGCASAPTTQSTIVPNSEDRMQFISAQEFSDSSGHTRTVIVMRDRKTSREYLTVIGGGVIELDYCSTGKTTYECEQ